MHLTKSFFSLIKITLSFGILPFLQKITYNKVVPKLQYYIITYSILRFHLINFKPYSKGVENEKAVFIRSMLDTSKLLDTCFKCFQNKQMIDHFTFILLVWILVTYIFQRIVHFLEVFKFISIYLSTL